MGSGFPFRCGMNICVVEDKGSECNPHDIFSYERESKNISSIIFQSCVGVQQSYFLLLAAMAVFICFLAGKFGILIENLCLKGMWEC